MVGELLLLMCSIAGELEFCSRVMAYQTIFHVLFVLEELLREKSSMDSCLTAGVYIVEPC